MKIYLATDHAGFSLKEEIKKYLTANRSYEVIDLGASTYNPSDDYPDYISQIGDKLGEDNTFAIIFGGSGQGEAIMANRYNGIRAAVYYGQNLEIIKLSRQHNNANTLSLAARFLSETEAQKAIDLWLETPFSKEERHERRINKIDQISQNYG